MTGYGPAEHYDRVTAAWTLLLGPELHYGVFATGSEDLPTATGELTRRMIDAASLSPGLELLDIGCGTGAPARRLAREHGIRVTGITTSVVGVATAREHAAAEGLADLLTFEERDGMDTGLPDASFDRIWALESSHLMRDRERLIAECARVLRPEGLLVLCDIVLVREMPFADVLRLREPLALLREVFGDARMESPDTYARLAAEAGLQPGPAIDLTAASRPTFARWRDNAASHRDELLELLGAAELDRFLEACDVMEGFWDDGTLGYALITARKAMQHAA